MNKLKTLSATALLVCTTYATPSAVFAADQSSSVAEAVSDTWITTKVKAELVTTDKVSGTDVSVTTVDGVVALVGVLPNQAEVDKAIALVRGVNGVKEVDSAGLKVGVAADLGNQSTKTSSDSSVGEVIDDAWITTKLKADLAATQGVPSRDIKVDTKDGTVTLTGALASQLEVDKAIATARAIKGVKEVNADGLVVEGR